MGAEVIAKIVEETAGVEGYLTNDEKAWLYTAASEIPLRGVVIECGAWKGLSGIFLSRGAQQKHGTVISVDINFWPAHDLIYDWFENIRRHTTAHNSLPIAGVGADYLAKTRHTPALVFIDSSHEYESTLQELTNAHNAAIPGGVIASHDYGHPDYPGVKTAWDEFCRKSGVEDGGKVDSIVWGVKKGS
jgi:predicted O-methyltransferase YrrM